jgi:hypothetical protein
MKRRTMKTLIGAAMIGGGITLLFGKKGKRRTVAK